MATLEELKAIRAQKAENTTASEGAPAYSEMGREEKIQALKQKLGGGSPASAPQDTTTPQTSSSSAVMGDIERKADINSVGNMLGLQPQNLETGNEEFKAALKRNTPDAPTVAGGLSAVGEKIGEFGMGPAFNAISGEQGALTNLFKGDSQKGDALKAAGALGSIGLEFATATLGGGAGPKVATSIAEKGLMEGIKRVASKISLGNIGKSSLIGAGFGASNAALNEEDADSTAVSAVTGGLFGAGIPILTKLGSKLIPTSVKRNISNIVEELFIPATKASRKGTSYKALQAEANKMGDGLVAVAKEKGDLSFIDKNGNLVEGKLPNTIAEASQAMQQVRNARYEQYSALSTEAKDAVIRGEDVAKKIQSNQEYQKGIKALYNSADDASVAKIEKQIERLNEVEFNPSELEGLIQKLNQDIQAALSSGRQLTASEQSQVLILKELRGIQDETLLNSLGEKGGKWLDLRKEYGAISQAEKALNKRFSNMFKNIKGGGLVGTTDIFSIGDLAYGLAAGNPASIARAVAQGAVAFGKKRAQDPDALIKKLFNTIDKSIK